MAEPKPQSMIARDLVGYGEFPPDPKWPGGAKIAVNFNLNVEAGGELTLANGDDSSEGTLNDIGFGPKQGIRVPLVNRLSNMAADVACGACSISFVNSKSISACSLLLVVSSKCLNWRMPSSNAAMKSSAMATDGLIIAR